jgi:hypothetical protein
MRKILMIHPILSGNKSNGSWARYRQMVNFFEREGFTIEYLPHFFSFLYRWSKNDLLLKVIIFFYCKNKGVKYIYSSSEYSDMLPDNLFVILDVLVLYTYHDKSMNLSEEINKLRKCDVRIFISSAEKLICGLDGVFFPYMLEKDITSNSIDKSLMNSGKFKLGLVGPVNSTNLSVLNSLSKVDEKFRICAQNEWRYALKKNGIEVEYFGTFHDVMEYTDGVLVYAGSGAGFKTKISESLARNKIPIILWSNSDLPIQYLRQYDKYTVLYEDFFEKDVNLDALYKALLSDVTMGREKLQDIIK